MGLSYKENVSDFRNSKAIEIAKKLKKHSKTFIYDPLIDEEHLKIIGLKNIDIMKTNIKFDIIMLLVPHNQIIKSIDKIIKKNTKNTSTIFDVKSVIKPSFISNRHHWML